MKTLYYTLFSRAAWRTGQSPIGNYETKEAAYAAALEIVKKSPVSYLSLGCRVASGFEIVGYFQS
jgi:hypothetical protein